MFHFFDMKKKFSPTESRKIGKTIKWKRKRVKKDPRKDIYLPSLNGQVYWFKVLDFLWH